MSWKGKRKLAGSLKGATHPGERDVKWRFKTLFSPRQSWKTRFDGSLTVRKGACTMLGIKHEVTSKAGLASGPLLPPLLFRRKLCCGARRQPLLRCRKECQLRRKQVKEKRKTTRILCLEFWRDQAPKREHGTLTLESTDTMAS